MVQIGWRWVVYIWRSRAVQRRRSLAVHTSRPDLVHCRVVNDAGSLDRTTLPKSGASGEIIALSPVPRIWAALPLVGPQAKLGSDLFGHVNHSWRAKNLP